MTTSEEIKAEMATLEEKKSLLYQDREKATRPLRHQISIMEEPYDTEIKATEKAIEEANKRFIEYPDPFNPHPDGWRAKSYYATNGSYFDKAEGSRLKLQQDRLDNFIRVPDGRVAERRE